MFEDTHGMQATVRERRVPTDDGISRNWKIAAARWAERIETDSTERIAAIYASGELFDLTNCANEPERRWQLSPGDWSDFLKNGAALLHSHPSGSEIPSEQDQRAQIATGKLFGLAARGQVFWMGNDSTEGLVGRGDHFGIQDCYTIFRSAFARKTGEWIPDAPRAWRYWKRGEPIFEERFESFGFRRLSVGEEMKPADGLLFKIRSPVANHIAFYMGEGQVLHHPGAGNPYDPTRLSRIESVERWLTLPHEVIRFAG